MAEHRLRVVPKRPNKAAARRVEIRDNLWPGAGPEIWDRHAESGFCTIPKTLPLIMTLIDDLEKGKNASRVYLDLWCRGFDEGLVEVTDEDVFAFSAGYDTPGRGVRSWRERIEILEELGFIRVKPNGSRKYGYILLRHPHKVIQELRGDGKIDDAWWGAFLKRTTEIGCVLP